MVHLSQGMTEDPTKYREDLFQRLDELRRTETFCDVTVAVKGKRFKAHKVVLAAASPFFLSLWESNMIESKEQLIEIKLEEATASVMEDVLQYIYSGNVSVTEESCHELIATADYLLLPGLKTLACAFLTKKVASYLQKMLAVGNCLFNYYFADKYHCVELKEECRIIINLHFSCVMHTEDFLNLEKNQVMEWVSSDDICVSSEEEVFKGIVKWVSHNRSEREGCFLDLLHQVRLRTLSRDFLLTQLVKEDLFTTNMECLKVVVRSMESVCITADESLAEAPRKCLRVLEAGIFVCGGKKALFYLPDDNEWYHIANLIFEHLHHAVIQFREKVYIFSKRRDLDEESHLDQTHVAEYYVPSTNSLGSIQTSLEYRDEEFSSVSILSGFPSLYAITEWNYDDAPFTYNHDENKWEIQDNVMLNRWGTCGVAIKHYLYIIGGSENNDTTATGLTKVERFNPRDKSLDEVAPLNEPRHGAFGAAINDKIYVAGGIQETEQSTRVLNTCEVYNPSTNEWHLMANLCVPRHSASMVCFKGALYVIGGLKNTEDEFPTRELPVEMFDSETSEWKEKCTIPVGFESRSREEENEQIHYKACFATVHVDVLMNPID